MERSHDASDAALTSDTYLRSEALHCAGRLDDALALLADAHPAQPTSASLSLLLLRGRILADQVFHAGRGYGEAVASLSEAHALAEQLGDERAAIDARELLALAEYYSAQQGGAENYAQLLTRFEETLARHEALGDSRGMAESLFHVGLMHERLHENDQARLAYERSYVLAKEHGHPRERSYAARHLGYASFAAGDLSAAQQYLEESLALRQELGCALILPLAHIAVGDVLLAQRDKEGAARHYEQAHALAEGMQSPLAVVFSLLALSELASARDEDETGRDYAMRALSRAETDELPLGVRLASATLQAIAEKGA